MNKNNLINESNFKNDQNEALQNYSQLNDTLVEDSEIPSNKLMRLRTSKINNEFGSGNLSISTRRLKLSNKSKYLIIVRVLLVFFMCIYLPLEIIFGSNFNHMENRYIFEPLDSCLPEIFKRPHMIFTTDSLIYLFSDKDMILLYSGFFYMVYHPFIAIKIVFVTHIVEFVLVIMRCLYQGYKPIWRAETTVTNICLTSYANPSLHFFFVTFFYLYLFISIHIVNKKKKRLSVIKKIFYICILILFVLFFGLIIIIKRINYLYQLVFAFTLSLIIIVIALDLENSIHNYIFNSLKNIYKIRKYKIRIFLILLSINILSIFLYNSIQSEALDLQFDNEMLNQHCSKDKLANLGIKSTFNEITYNYGIIGAFWGVSLTVEKNCGEWWNSSKKFSFVKIFITLLFGASYIFIFSLFESSSFEFNYFVLLIKYFFFNYLLMGWLPILFDKCKLSKRINKTFLKNKSLFTQSLFSISHNNFESQEDSLPDYIKNKNLYSKTILVGGLETKNSLENLEFLIGKQTLVEQNMMNQSDNDKKDDSMLN